MNDEITIEALGDVAARQALLTDPMRAMLDEHGPDATVAVLSRHTPFGTYVLEVRVA